MHPWCPLVGSIFRPMRDVPVGIIGDLSPHRKKGLLLTRLGVPSAPWCGKGMHVFCLGFSLLA